MLSESEKNLLDKISAEKSGMLDLVTKWANINSGSTHLAGLQTMQQKLCDAFSTLADTTETLKAKPINELNHQGQITQTTVGDALLFTKRKNAKYKILFMGHMDTVFGKNHPFQTVTQKDANILQGPGVADLKGGLVVLLHTLKAFEQSPVANQIGWEILINGDEELGSRGSAEHIVEAAKRNQMGLVFEPSLPDGAIVGERQGIGNFTVAVQGVAAHAGRDHHLGRSAIVAMSEFIIKVEQLNGTISDVTLNVGKMSGGESVNSVPAHAICQIDIRVKNANDFSNIEKQILGIAGQIRKKDGITLKIEGSLNRPPKPVTEAVKKMYSAYEEIAKDLNFDIRLIPSGGCCDGNNLLAAGLPNLDTLGVRGGAIHSDQEYMLIDSLVERTQMNTLFLLRHAAIHF